MAKVMTAAERMRAYRARIRNDSGRHIAFKKHERDRKKENRQNLNIGELKELRKKGTVATRTWRLKKAIEKEIEPEASVGSGHGYSSRNSIQKAVVRCKLNI